MKKRIFISAVICLIVVISWQMVRQCGRGHRDAAHRNNVLRQWGTDGAHSGISGDEKRAPGTGIDGDDDASPVDIAMLHRRFPGNRALPPLTEQDRARMKKERAEREMLFARINSNRASRAEIHRYYRDQEEIAGDGIELASFILEEYEGRLGLVERKKQEFLVEQFKKRLVLIPRREKEALDRIGGN